MSALVGDLKGNVEFTGGQISVTIHLQKTIQLQDLAPNIAI